MNILNYTAFFHDGNLIDIKHFGNNIDLFLESAEISANDLQETVALSEENTLRGILHVRNVQKVHVNGTTIHNHLSMNYQDGEILHLKIDDNKVSLLVEWKNFPPKGQANDVSRIEIEPIEITWESFPFFRDK